MLYKEIEFLKLLETIRTEKLVSFFEAVTWFGEETIMVLIVASLWFAVDKRFAQKLFFVTVASLGVNSIVKNFAKIPRPFADGKIICARPETATGYSFPSGHTQNFATWSTTIALKLKKIWFWIIICLLIPLVAFSRLFLGAHYPSDVIAGVIFGVILAVVCGKIYDKVQNKHRLYMWLFLAMTPFAVWFMIDAQPLFEDFYKIYGMTAGLILSVMFEERYAPLEFNVSRLRKAVRVIIAVTVAYLVKEGTGFVGEFLNVQINFIIEIIKYLILVFSVFGLCPLVFKKLGI